MPFVSDGSPTSHDPEHGPNPSDAVWNAVVGSLRGKVKGTVLSSWFEPIAVEALLTDAVILRVPDDRFRDYVAAQFHAEIERSLEEVLNRRVRVHYTVGRAAEPAVSGAASRPEQQSLLPETPPFAATMQADPSFVPTPAPAQAPAPQNSLNDTLNSLLRFENFVVGDSNEFAVSVGHTVAEAPARAYNPLFIYGGVGLGKTHLLHAVGHHIRRLHPELHVVYAPMERYVEEVVNAMRSSATNAMGEIRAKYRDTVDVLLVDDIQVMAGRDRTQEEFFHTFNALHGAGKQIVVTSDRFPVQLKDFNERLRSRFEWGITVDIKPPDRDTRIGILRTKAKAHGIGLPDDVACYLADNLRSNVRELEGALNKLVATSKLGARRIDLEMARQALGPMVEMQSRRISIDMIQRTVAQYSNLKVADLKGEKRHKAVVLPRMLAMYLTRKHTEESFPEIGKRFGGRDHSTVINACQRIEWMLTSDMAVQKMLQDVETLLGR